MRCKPFGRNELEFEPVALPPFEGVAQMGGGASFQREFGQGHDGVLAEFHDAESGVEIKRQALGANLIEGGAAAMGARHPDEAVDETAPFLRGADRVEQRDPASAPLAEHQERTAAVGEEKALVGHKREHRVSARLPVDDRLRLGELRCVGPGRESDRRPQKLKQAETDGQNRGAEQRAEGARRLGVELELPPQAVRPAADVVKGEKENAEGRSDNAGDRGEPAPGEGLVEHGGRAIKLLARRQQEESEEKQEGRFAKRESLEEGEDEAQRAQRKRQLPRAVAPVEQSARDEQKDHADQAAEKVGAFHRPERYMHGELGEAACESRRRSRHEEHRPGRESDHAHEHRREPRGGARELVVGRRLPAPDRDAKLEIGECGGGDDERQQIVDASVRDERGGDPFEGRAAAKGPEHDDFEYAGSSRNVDNRREGRRHGKDRGEGEEVDRGRGKKHPERRRSADQPDRRQPQLGRKKASARRGERDGAKPHGPRRAKCDESGDAGQGKARSGPYQGRRPPEQRAGRSGLDETGDAAHARKPDGEAAHDEDEQTGDIIGPDSCGAVDPVTDRRRSQDAEPDRMAKRAAAESAEQEGRRRRAGPDVAHRAGVAGDKRCEAHRRRGDRQENRRRRQMPDDANHLMVVDVGDRVAEGGDQPTERKQNRKRRQQPLQAGLRKDPEGAADVDDIEFRVARRRPLRPRPVFAVSGKKGGRGHRPVISIPE